MEHFYKEFSVEQISFLKQLESHKICNIEWVNMRPFLYDYFTLRFDNGIILDVECFMRFVNKTEIVLSSHDPYFSKDFFEYEIQSTKEPLPGDNLLTHTLRAANEQLVGTFVRKVEIFPIGDIKIYFSNETVLQIYTDVLNGSCNYYNIDDGQGNQHTVSCVDGKIKYCILGQKEE